MRIEEFSIRKYGPLPDTGRVAPGKFCLFFGNNEDGKTLTIDALTKILFGRNVKIFRKIDRVEETPDGFLVIKDDKGREIKLPEKGDLVRLIGISPSEARNIFIIRDSDLFIEAESEHYRHITDRLTGMKTQEIEKIKACLLDIGKLTAGGDFRDIRDEKLKSRINDARDLIKEIEKTNKEIKEENFDELEKELSEISDKINLILQKLRQYELAENREKYEKGNKALITLDAARKKLKELEIFTREDEREWMGYELDIRRERERKKKLQTELRRLEKNFEKINEIFKREKREFEITEKTKKKIDDDIRPDIRNYEMKAGELEQKRGQSKFFSKAMVISAILFLTSMVGLIVNPAVTFFYTLSILFFFSTAGFGFLRYQLTREEAWMKGMLERIRLDTAKFKLQGETIQDILSNIQKFDYHYAARKKELEEIDKETNLLKGEIKKLEEKDIPEAESKIKYAEDGISEIKSRTRINSLSGYRDKLKELQKQKSLVERQTEALSTLFGEEEEELGKNVLSWREEVSSLEIYKDKATGIEYNKKEEDKLKNNKEELFNNKGNLENKIQNFHESLSEIERRVNNIFKLEADFLYCKTSIDLEAIKKRLQEFINDNENAKENVSIAMSIFDQIQKGEEEKVSSLFGKDSIISKYFCKITDGIYTEVNFVPEESKIYVRNKKGEVLNAESLSGGAYDQLYLSIRLGLGESLLMGRKAFFVMDDPFIKADKKRLKEQIEILKKISEAGWQVLYFSAKDEVKEVLNEDIENGKISYVELQGIYS